MPDALSPFNPIVQRLLPPYRKSAHIALAEGATLAAEAARLGLIDEYYMRVYPVLVGGGLPFFARDEQRRDLELLETRSFDSGVAYLRYAVRH